MWERDQIHITNCIHHLNTLIIWDKYTRQTKRIHYNYLTDNTQTTHHYQIKQKPQIRNYTSYILDEQRNTLKLLSKTTNTHKR